MKKKHPLFDTRHYTKTAAYMSCGW